MKLEQLSPYLAYELKGIFTHLPGNRVFTMTGITLNNEEDYDPNIDVTASAGVYGGVTADVDTFKPLLRPLDDLKKEEWNSFCEEHEFDKSKISNTWGTDLQYNGKTTHWGFDGNYSTLCELFKNHFDVFDLIGKGEAIHTSTFKTK